MQRLDQPVPHVAGPRDLIRRITLWFNLTVIHQAFWPVIALLAGSPIRDTGVSSWGVAAGLAAGPIMACLLALVYLRGKISQFPAPSQPSVIATNFRIIAVGLPIMVLIGRLLGDNPGGTVKVALVGAVNVAAFHLIHFGVVRTVFERSIVIVPLFGLSWAIHQMAEALARDSGDSLILSGIGGFTAGVLVALGALLVHRWPGGRITAPALHWMAIYLVLGFTT